MAQILAGVTVLGKIQISEGTKGNMTPQTVGGNCLGKIRI